MRRIFSFITAFLLLGSFPPVHAKDPYAPLDEETVAIYLGTCSAQPSTGVGLFTFDSKLCWNVGSKLKVQFLDGTSKDKEFVMKTASGWSAHANVTFKQVDSAGDIRVTFLSPGFSSSIGRAALNLAVSKPTMNLGFRAQQSKQIKRAVVLHEFGHALGFAHEHQSPNAKIQWNREAVYKHFGATQGWDPETIEVNVLRAEIDPRGSATTFDPKSIMLYPIPKELTLNGFSSSWNLELSRQDKEHARNQYPKLE